MFLQITFPLFSKDTQRKTIIQKFIFRYLSRKTHFICMRCYTKQNSNSFHYFQKYNTCKFIQLLFQAFTEIIRRSLNSNHIVSVFTNNNKSNFLNIVCTWCSHQIFNLQCIFLCECDNVKSLSNQWRRKKKYSQCLSVEIPPSSVF